MTNFTPWSALIGGLLIGGAAVILLALNGRIAGVSGIVSGLFGAPSATGGPSWRILFLLGLVLGTALHWALLGRGAALRLNFPVGVLVLAGLLTGYGTAMAGGCTSGHGVCGLARFSVRSLVVVAVFLAAGVVTTGVARHLWGLA